jgi:hypothetical protein
MNIARRNRTGISTAVAATPGYTQRDAIFFLVLCQRVATARAAEGCHEIAELPINGGSAMFVF